MTFMRTALNAQRKTRPRAGGFQDEFMKIVRDTAASLGISQDMLRRAVNVGFSGGEKKRNEILQMAVLQPRLAVLDETDFRPRHRRAAHRRDASTAALPDRSMIVITHYQRLLEYIVPDIVHVMAKGRVVKWGPRSSRSSSRPRATPSSRRRRPRERDVRAIKTDREGAVRCL